MLGRLGESENAEGDMRSDPDREGTLELTDETEKDEALDAAGECVDSHGDPAEERADATELREDVIMPGYAFGWTRRTEPCPVSLRPRCARRKSAGRPNSLDSSCTS